MDKKLLNEITRIKQLMNINEELMLNEDNLQVKGIAKDLYTYLKKVGVSKVYLNAGFKKQIGQQSGMSSGGSLDNTAQIYYWDDPKTKQTLIQIVLYGEISKTREIKNKLLSTYPGLEVVEQNENNQYINFTVKEKTTAKGGLVGNTQTNNNSGQQQQPVNTQTNNNSGQQQQAVK